MSTPASPTSTISTRPRGREDGDLKGLLRQFGVAECRRCDTTILLGETAPGDWSDLCPSCRALPATAARPPLQAESALILDLGALPDERSLSSQAA